VSLRPELELPVLRQMRGLPADALDALVRLLARICEDPYGRLHSMAAGQDPHERIAEIGDAGWIEFTVDEKAGLIRVHALVWIG
jgi:hypothetical protein